MTDYTTIRLDHDDAGVATLTFDRPEHFNGVTVTMAAEMTDALDRVAGDREVRVLVLTGAGRSFCPGADVHGSNAQGGPAPADVSPVAADISLPIRLYELPVPTIAAVNGACAGAGFGFACACDLRVAARSAVFRSSFLTIGVAGDMGLPWLLPRLIGESAAKRLSLLDDKLSAGQALELGLLTSVHDDADFPAAVATVAAHLAGRAPLAARALKQHYLTAARVDFRSFIDLEFQRLHHLFATDDAREGFAAFSERRIPRFTGR
ncbi:enoyl-CoA hydratase/isomerase family protein [Nocardia flavorosea]|uniref:Enoyl-CoA hydratase n=1 Tax=Nocardia flavorosea TaxID=53429 RepID=A0A846YN22_9NOCA|nr:enoyl-CoA hydratase-related protein [Nocardia flavorosea]NKY58954.1 hypothetical protein [Nocardia flavorosea]